MAHWTISIGISDLVSYSFGCCYNDAKGAWVSRSFTSL